MDASHRSLSQAPISMSLVNLIKQGTFPRPASPSGTVPIGPALGPGALGGVGAVAAVGTGLYAAGYFPSASATNIAKWDRTNWSALGDGVSLLCPGLEGDCYVCGLVEFEAVFGAGRYGGGSFRSAGGFGVKHSA